MIDKFDDSEYIAKNMGNWKMCREEGSCRELYVQCAAIVSMFIELLHEIKKTDSFSLIDDVYLLIEKSKCLSWSVWKWEQEQEKNWKSESKIASQ